MSMSQYAQHRGVSKQAVSVAVKKGRISCKWEGVKAFIDSEKADREWGSNTDLTTAPQREEAPPPPAEPTAEPERRLGVAGAAAILKGYQAKLAKLQFEEKSGKLVATDVVEHDAFRVARAVRDGMLSIPAKVSAELAAETDPFEVHKKLEREIRLALENLATELETQP